MSTTDSWSNRNRGRDRDEEAAGRQAGATLGDWLDAVTAADGETARRSRRSGRGAEENSWSDARGNDRILQTALSELEAREQRMERRTDEMLDALDRWMARTDQPSRRVRPGDEPERNGRLDAALDQIERRLADISSRIDARTSAAQPSASTQADLDARLADIARRIDEAYAARRPDMAESDRLTRLESSLETIAKRLNEPPAAAPAPLNGPRQRPRQTFDSATAQIRARQLQLDAGGGAAPMDDLGARIAALADRLESAPTQAASAMAPAVETIRSEIATLAARLDAPRPTAPAMDAIRSEIAALVGRLGAPRETADLSPLQDQIASLAARLDRPRETTDLSPLQDQIASLAARLDQPRETADLSPLQDQIASLAARLDQPRETTDLSPLQDQIASLAARLDQPRSNVDLAALNDKMATLRTVVASAIQDKEYVKSVDPTEILDGIESRIDAAGGRISNDVRSHIQVAIQELRKALESHFSSQGSGLLARAVQDLAARFDETRGEPAGGEALQRIELQIKTLAARFDRLEAEPAAAIDGRQLERLAEEMRRLAQEIDPTSSIAKLEGRLLALDAKLEDVKNRPLAAGGKDATKFVAPDLTGLEALIRDLTDRMETVRAEQTSPAQLEELHAHIRQVADKLDRSDGSQALMSIERSVSDLFAQIDMLRSDRHEATETVARQAAVAAAREVADDLVRRATADVAGAAAHHPRIVALAEDVSELRRSTDFVDRKTHETLEAIHSALETIVQRLGSVELELSSAARPAKAASPLPPLSPMTPAAPPVPAGPPPAVKAPAPPEPFIAEADAPRLTGRRQVDTPPPDETSRSRFSIKLPFLGRDKKAAPALDSTGAAGNATAEDDTPANAPDLPLEPGSGRPGVLSAKADADVAAAAKANFIAAARRAAQMASDEASAARSASASTPGSKVRASAPSLAASGAEAGKSFLETRKKPILIGLAALTAAAIAVNLLVPAGDGKPAVAPTVEEKMSAAPADVIAPIVPAPAAPDPTPLAPAAPASGRADSAAADPLPVGSISPAQEQAVAPSIPAAPPPTGGLDLPPGISAPTLRAAAQRGDPAAAHEIGVRLIDGRGVARDPKLALKWFERAAAEGLAPAQFRVGNMYEKGVGAPRDAKIAKLWYQRAAEKGNAKALHNLGVLIAEGGDGKPDYAVAADLFRKAAKLGVRDSQYNIAILLARGLGVSPSMPEAYTWLSVAAQQGDEESGKKRDEIAARLTADELAAARAAAQAFKPEAPDRFANDVAPPERGWDAAQPVPARPKPKGDGARI